MVWIYNITHYNNKIDTLTEKDREKLKTIIEVIYMLIKDIAKNENVNMEVLNKICDKLDCKIEQVIEYTKEN